MSKDRRVVPAESTIQPDIVETIPHFVVPRQDTPLHGCPTTIDTRTERGKAQLLAAMGVPDMSVDPTAPLTIDVEGFLVYPDSRVDEQTGETSEFVRTILISPDGHTFGTTSEVVLKRLQAMLQLWPSCPWHPPLRCIIVARIGKKNKRLYHDLRVEVRE